MKATFYLENTLFDRIVSFTPLRTVSPWSICVPLSGTRLGRIATRHTAVVAIDRHGIHRFVAHGSNSATLVGTAKTRFDQGRIQCGRARRIGRGTVGAARARAPFAAPGSGSGSER